MGDAKVRVYMQAVVDGLLEAKDEVRQALGLIGTKYARHDDPLAVQLLAVRRYLRIERKLGSIWTWSREEAKTRMSEEPCKTLFAEAHKVVNAFETQNPGYSLGITPIRSLEKQASLWCKNSTVHRAGQGLLKKMRKELDGPVYPEAPSALGLAWFRNSLRVAGVNPEPSSAAPGTSDHGRGTAVDFVVKRSGAIIASVETSQIETVWKPQGWHTKLAKACEPTRLKGPLKHPYEPWHWML